MNGELLLGFSEFALALAGFAAIALVLGRREGILSPGSAYVVQFMVVNALGPGLLGLLAVVLYVGDVPEPILLRICSAIYLVAAVFFALLSLKRERSLASEGGLVLPPLLGRAIWVGAILSYGVHLGNLAVPELGLFLLGLWILLCMAAVQFVALLFLAFR